jgi:hypothetical protein
MKTSRSWRVPIKLTPEGAIKQAVRQYLGFKGYRVYNIASGAFAHKGISDLIALKDGRTLFIEIKAPKGKQSVYQAQFQEEVEGAGCIYLLVNNFDVFMELMESGK